MTFLVTIVTIYQMSKELIEALKHYKDKNNMTWPQLAERMGTTRMNLYRWREASNVKGIGEKIVREFLEKEKQAGRL